MGTKSKYSHHDRRSIQYSIEHLKNNDDFSNIFKILTTGGNSYTLKNNQMYMDISRTSDSILDQVSEYLYRVKISADEKIDVDDNIIPQCNDEFSHNKNKLSNYEKNILKQRRLKKNTGDGREYRHLKFDDIDPKKTKKKTLKKTQKKNPSYSSK